MGVEYSIKTLAHVSYNRGGVIELTKVLTQECFDKLYADSIEANKVTLTNSKVINYNELLDAAIYKMYFMDGKTLDDIHKILENSLIQFKEDFTEFLK